MSVIAVLDSLDVESLPTDRLRSVYYATRGDILYSKARIHNLQYLEELVDAWPLRGIGVQFNHIIAQELELRLEFEFGRFEGTEYLAVV